MYILNENINTKYLNKQLNYLLELTRITPHQVFDMSTLKRRKCTQEVSKNKVREIDVF